MDDRPAPPDLSAAEAEAILRDLAAETLPAAPPAPPPAEPAPPPTPPPAASHKSAPGPARLVTPDALRGLVEAIPDGLVITDDAGRIVLVNAQTERLFGYRREELIGQPIEILIPERFRARHVGQRDGYFASPHARPMGQGLQLVGRRRDGHEVPVEIALSPLRTDDGLLVVASVRDVTERRKAEADLRKAEARFRTLVEGIPAVTFLAALDEGVNELYVSPQIEELLGFTQAEWLTDPILWYSQLHPDDRPRWHQEFARTCSTGEPFRSVYRFVARDGRVVWVHGEAQVVRDRDGRPLFLQGVAFDVTGIKRAEEELRAVNQTLEERVAERTAALRVSEERYRLMVEGVRDYAIFLLDPDGRVASWNPGAERIKGYPAAEIVGRHFSAFYPPDADPAGTTAAILRAAAADGRYEAEGWRVRKDGSRFWANVLVTALRDPDGRLVGFTKFTRDLTERRRAQEELAARTRELERSNDELSQFTRRVTHDLFEPLRTMKSWVQRLAEHLGDGLDDSARAFYAKSIRAADRMKSLIEALLAYSRVRTHGKDPTPARCGDVLTQACDQLHAAVEEAGAEVAAGPLPTVLADPDQLAQLFQNLVGNALKFRSPDRPARVTVTARLAEPGWWRVDVADNGIGIEPEYLRRIFGLGERLHGASKYPGHGIGLATCEKIVERHGGRIWAESDGPDRGATVSFTLPAAE